MTARFPRLALLLAFAGVVAGCARPTPSATPTAPLEATHEVAVEPKAEPSPESTLGLVPGPHDRIVADAEAARVPAFRHPGAEEPFEVFSYPDAYGARPSFLVNRVRGDWLEAYLPTRPNEVTGWLRARDVSVRLDPYRIEIDLSDNRLEVLKTGKPIMKESVAVGTGGTPTPTGQFFTTILVKFPDPSGAYGPYAYGLSAYSEVLFSFGGGNGQVAIHGTNAPWALGRAVSHGCIRISNDAIKKMSTFLPLGTPVRIRY